MSSCETSCGGLEQVQPTSDQPKTPKDEKRRQLKNQPSLLRLKKAEPVNLRPIDAEKPLYSGWLSRLLKLSADSFEHWKRHWYVLYEGTPTRLKFFKSNKHFESGDQEIGEILLEPPMDLIPFSCDDGFGKDTVLGFILKEGGDGKKYEFKGYEVEEVAKWISLVKPRILDQDELIRTTSMMREAAAASSSNADLLSASGDGSSSNSKNHPVRITTETTLKLRQLRDAVIGEGTVMDGPFGPRRITYSDYTGSGKAVSFIEEYIQKVALPLYANTHTETSTTGLYTTQLREDARATILKLAGGDPEKDVVLFTGFGSTGAIDHLVQVLNLKVPRELEAKYNLSEQIPEEERPVVFIGPYEHHSNILSWRESICKVVQIKLTSIGTIDLRHLKQALEKYKSHKTKIGSFSAASNVTGTFSDVKALSILLHKYNAFAFFDFAAAGPYFPIEMNGAEERCNFSHLEYKDAVFLSPHKFVGGPGSPGILIAKRHLFQNRVPAHPAGGTVLFTQPWGHYYYKGIEAREEGGTPCILGAMRSALAFKVKAEIGEDVIHHVESRMIKKAIKQWSKNPNIVILGNPNLPRLGICSMLIKHKNGRYLHYNYCAALFNDLFGIQSRGGCSCAGPYGHYLLNVDRPTSEIWKQEVLRGFEGSKPGWFRVNFPYFLSEIAVQFIMDAIEFVANHGAKLLPLYEYNPHSGSWVHKSAPKQNQVQRITLDPVHGIKLLGSKNRTSIRAREVIQDDSIFKTYMEEAMEVVENVKKLYDTKNVQRIKIDQQFEESRWFALPQDVLPDSVSSTIGNYLLKPKVTAFDESLANQLECDDENQDLLDGLANVWDQLGEAQEEKAQRHRKMDLSMSGSLKKRTVQVKKTLLHRSKMDHYKERFFSLENMNLCYWPKEKDSTTSVPTDTIPLHDAGITITLNALQEPVSALLTFPIRPSLQIKAASEADPNWSKWIDILKQTCKTVNEETSSSSSSSSSSRRQRREAKNAAKNSPSSPGSSPATSVTDLSSLHGPTLVAALMEKKRLEQEAALKKGGGGERSTKSKSRSSTGWNATVNSSIDNDDISTGPSADVASAVPTSQPSSRSISIGFSRPLHQAQKKN